MQTIKKIILGILLLNVALFAHAISPELKDIMRRLDNNSNSSTTSSSPSIIETIPGYGVSPIELGDSNSSVINKLGNYDRKVSYSTEHKRWIDYGYNTDKELPFYIGFDYLYEYGPTSNKSDAPIWKVYFKNNKVVYIVLTSFAYDTAATRRTGVDSNCLFYQSERNVNSCLGNDYFYFLDEAKNGNYMYLTKGLVFITVGGEIRTISIHRKLSAQEIRKFKSNYK